jgi:gluconolactonase
MEYDRIAPGFERIVAGIAPLEVIARDVQVSEGPLWNRRTGQFYWTSIVGNTIWRWTPGAGHEVFMRPSYKADGMTFDPQGRLVVAGWAWRRVWRMELDGTIRTLCSHYDGKNLNTPNDIVVRSDGSIYFTDPPGALGSVGMEGDDVQRYLDYCGVYRISPAGETTLVVKDMTYPNGLAFSPDEALLYVNDTREFLVRAFEVHSDGTLGKGSVFCEITGSDEGMPDGLKVDSEGNVYCTGPGGIHVFSPSGSLLGRLKVPAHVNNMGWGDDDWRGLYINCDTVIFRTRLGIPGTPTW